MKVLTEAQVEHYRREGYAHLQGVVPQEVQDLAQRVLEGWVDGKAREWKQQGLIDSLHEEEPFRRRLLVLWEAAGKPRYSRSPRREIVCEDTFRMLSDPALLDVAADLIETDEITVHGIFNARPKCPHQLWTDTPWHQDAQYGGISPQFHVPTFWFPLHAVDESTSCLVVEPRRHGGKLFEPYEDVTGFLGISPEERKAFKGVPIRMQPGDLLCFTSLTPHCARTTESELVRWSMDVRYQSTDTIEGPGKELGFVARSEREPASVESAEQWIAKPWAGKY